MAVNLRIDGLMVVAVAVVAGGAYLMVRKNEVAAAINPASDRNLAYRGVNAIGAEISGDQHFTLGGWLYDITHTNHIDERE